MLQQTIRSWIDQLLVYIGISADSARGIDQWVILAIIVAIGVGLDFLIRLLLLQVVRRVVKQTKVTWDDIIFDDKVLRRLCHIVTPILVVVMLPIAFPDQNGLVVLITRLVQIAIVTLPPYLLVSDSFQNWEGMRSSGGRRVKRSINIDMTSIRFCTPEMLERYKRIDLLKDYIARTQQRVEEYNRQHDIPSGEDKINGLHQTNIGVFRNYMNLYLRQNERVNQNMMVLVRQLQPTEQGLPMELYFFTDTVDWVPYEGIQADVFDHVLAVIPEFDLRVFQNPSGNDLRTLTGKTDTNH